MTCPRTSISNRSPCTWRTRMVPMATSSDEQQLRARRELHEVGSADDALYVVTQVRLGQVVHVGRHPARPQMPAGCDDLIEEVRDLWHAEVGDRLLQHVGRYRGHP